MSEYKDYIALDSQITPFFSHMSLENVMQSELKGQPVMDVVEVVQLRLAGDKNFSPIHRSDAQAYRDGNTVITFAERFGDQYRAFLNGDAQLASGTPLERLNPYGITPAQISILKANRVYTVEALKGLEGRGVKNLGQHANELKRMANDYYADMASGSESQQEIDRLKAELAELKAKNFIPDAKQEKQIQKETGQLAIEDMDEAQLKDYIEERSGVRPKGNPSVEILRQSALEL